MKEKEYYLHEIFKILDSIDRDFKDWNSLSNSIVDRIKSLKKQNLYCICCNDFDEKKLPKTNFKIDSIINLHSQVLDLSKDLTFNEITYKRFICSDCYIEYEIDRRRDSYLNKRKKYQEELERGKLQKRQETISWNMFTKGERGFTTPYQRLEFVSHYVELNSEKAKEIIDLPYNKYLNH